MLLKRLKAGGYRIVQAVPAGDRPAAVPERGPVQVAAAEKQGWPRVIPPTMGAAGKVPSTAKPAVARKDAAFRLKLASRKSATVVATSNVSTLFNR